MTYPIQVMTQQPNHWVLGLLVFENSNIILLTFSYYHGFNGNSGFKISHVRSSWLIFPRIFANRIVRHQNLSNSFDSAIVPLSSGRYSSDMTCSVQCLRFSFGDPEFEPILGDGTKNENVTMWKFRFKKDTYVMQYYRILMQFHVDKINSCNCSDFMTSPI